MWDMTSGHQLASMQRHTARVSSLTLSGSLLVSSSYDKSVKLWHTGIMQFLHTLHGHSDSIHSVAVSSDGRKRLLSGGLFNLPSDGEQCRKSSVLSLERQTVVLQNWTALKIKTWVVIVTVSSSRNSQRY